jgi:hypothetical protein
MYYSLRFIFVSLLLFISIGCIFSNNVVIRETDKTDFNQGEIFRLDRLNVYCQDNEVISYWRLETTRDKKMLIQYYCISSLSVLVNSVTKYTNWNRTNDNKKNSLNFLDRHRILCSEDEAIGGFQMERSGDSIRFRYRCNKIKYDSLKSKTTDWENANFGEVQNLSVHSINGPDYKNNSQVLRGFKMLTKYVNQWCTFMCPSFQYIKFEIFYSNLTKIEYNLDNEKFNFNFLY